jgi:phenylacetate-CoA ligase
MVPKGFVSRDRVRVDRATRGFWDEVTETLPCEQLRELQFGRLRWQLTRCYEGSAFYRAKLADAGVTPSDVRSLEDIARLPVVTKDELREEQGQYPPFGRYVVAEQASWRELHPSTGTTGTPVNTIWSARDVEAVTDFTARTMWQFGVRPSDVVQNAFAYGLWVAGLSCHYAAAQIGCLVIPMGTAVTTEKQIDFFRRARATALVATPSYALHMAATLREQGLDVDELALERGCFGGEPGTENASTRAKIEVGLGIQAFDYYGLAEVWPTFASECEAKAGLHFAEDHVLVECLDPATGRATAEGEIGVLVFTHLTREATPMLRYWSNDYARLTTEACVCGRTHARALGGIVGRHDDLVVFRGAKFYPSQVEEVIRTFSELSDEFRIEVRREERGGLVAGCVVVAETLAGGEDELAEQLRRALRRALGVTPAVRLEPYGTLERTTFKAKRLVEVTQRAVQPPST